MYPLRVCNNLEQLSAYTPLLSVISVTPVGVPLPLPPFPGPVISSTIAASACNSSVHLLVDGAQLALKTIPTQFGAAHLQLRFEAAGSLLM